MRFFRFACFALFVSLCVVACKDKPKSEPASKPSIAMTVDKRDTTKVLRLTEQFLEHLKANRIDSAMAMLHYLDTAMNVVPLPDELAAQQRMVFKRFPVLSYKIDAITFYSDKDSQVKYTIEFFKKEPGDPRPNTTSFFIKPVRVKQQWYLTMFDSNSYNGGATKIKN